jgi:hypothetical protein
MNDSYVKMLKPLIGGKVKHIIVDPSPYGETYMGLVIEVGKKTYELIGLSDPEGNGPGFLQITKISDFSKQPVDSGQSNR